MLRLIAGAAGFALVALALTSFSSREASPLLVADPPRGRAQPIAIHRDEPLAQVSDRYLSVAIDVSQVVGGHWWAGGGGTLSGVGDTRTEPFDFERRRLRNLARELGPAYLRIGGTEADRVYYDLGSRPLEGPPEGFDHLLSRTHLDQIGAFATDVGYEIIFTLNAGPGYRDANRTWDPAPARTLIQYAVDRSIPVAVWELGNEVGAYPFFHGPKGWITGSRYVRDTVLLRELTQEIDPAALVAGPSSAYWPRWGEMGRFYEGFMTAGGGAAVDVITWHYYPQQSQRCPIASRRAAAERRLGPGELDEVSGWAIAVEQLRDQHAPETQIWLGETGNAQCGGEPGISDVFGSTFWWLDQLGQVAARGQQVTVRQTLAGSDYGLIDGKTLEPAPDYFASVLWKRLMGSTVLATAVTANARDGLRAYAHCTRDDRPGARATKPGSITVVAINLDAERTQLIELNHLGEEMLLYLATAHGAEARHIAFNGQPATVDNEGRVAAIEPRLVEFAEVTPWLELPPLTWAFMVFPDAAAAACDKQ